eukprot:360399-Chlamydomonas_euryale.AAC.2
MRARGTWHATLPSHAGNVRGRTHSAQPCRRRSRPNALRTPCMTRLQAAQLPHPVSRPAFSKAGATTPGGRAGIACAANAASPPSATSEGPFKVGTSRGLADGRGAGKDDGSGAGKDGGAPTVGGGGEGLPGTRGCV